MAEHPAPMNLWQTEHVKTIPLSEMGRWAGDGAEFNIGNYPSNEMNTEGIPHIVYFENHPMPLSGNVPHFGGAIGDSPSGMSALSNEDLVRVNTETAKIISLPDVNDPRALQIYGQLFRFRENATMLELLINEPDKLQQVTLCALAHNLDLQYEYCVSSRRARITRSSQLERPARDTFMRQAHLADEFPAMPYLSNGSHDSGIQTQYSPDLSFSVDSNGFLRDAQMFPTTTAFTHSVGACMESQIPSICDLQNGFSNLQHIQHVQQNPSFHQLETTHTSNDDKEPRDSLYLQQASVAVIAPWHRPGSIASSKRSSPSLCSGTSSHRSTPSFRKKISTRSASKSLRLCQYCGESFKRTSFLGMHKCLNAGEMRYQREIEGSSRKFAASYNLHNLTKLNSDKFIERDYEAQQRASSTIYDSASFSVNSFQSSAGHDSISGSSFSSSLFSTEVLPSPGRRGPLSSSARADAKAVKDIKACWRCKILRKKCDTENPCQICPKSVGSSHWHSIGCRRKSLTSESVPIGLCPGPLSQIGDPKETTFVEHVNNLLTLGSQKRDVALKRLEKVVKSESIDPDTKFSRRSRIEQALTETWALKFSFSPLLDILLHSPALEKPLSDCILAIVWELLANPGSRRIVNAEPVESLIFFLCSAAQYQEALDEDQLIAQSLICLQTCLETMRIQALGQLTEVQHRACAQSQCTIECISNLTLHLEVYLKNFSRVIFCKEALQGNRAWWLSTFYSLCVQSLVRSCLIAIVERYATSERAPNVIGAQRSLHLALRLFIASSGGHDPLVLTWTRETMSSSRPEEAGRAVHYKLAQSAVQQSTWHDRKIRNSRDYLNKIFKDDGIFDALDCRNGTSKARPLITPRESFNESNAHAEEQQFECQACKRTFKDEQAEEHQYYIHQHHSWSCAALFNYDYSAAFHSSPTRPTEADECGYCGAEFPRTDLSHHNMDPKLAIERDREARVGHLFGVHKFGECKHPKLFSISKFRLHLRGIHAITSGEWMNILGNACLKEEAQQESMFQGSQTPKLRGIMHNACNDEPHGSNLHVTSETASSRDTSDMPEDLMQGLRKSSLQFTNIRSE